MIPMPVLDETTILHLIKPADLNHHGTLFAGRMAEWLVEACFIAASRLVGRSEDVLCVRVHDMTFKRPFRAGDIVSIRSSVAHLGSRSITVHGSAAAQGGDATKGKVDAAVTILITFVTVDEAGKPYEHGLSLPAEYLAANSDICERGRKAAQGPMG